MIKTTERCDKGLKSITIFRHFQVFCPGGQISGPFPWNTRLTASPSDCQELSLSSGAPPLPDGASTLPHLTTLISSHFLSESWSCHLGRASPHSVASTQHIPEASWDSIPHTNEILTLWEPRVLFGNPPHYRYHPSESDKRHHLLRSHMQHLSHWAQKAVSLELFLLGHKRQAVPMITSAARLGTQLMEVGRRDRGGGHERTVAGGGVVCMFPLPFIIKQCCILRHR